MERTVLSALDQDSEMSDALEELREELSEDSTDKAKNASLTVEETTDGLDATGLVPGEELDSSEDSTEELQDALNGNLEKPERLSAGTKELESLEDTSEMDGDTPSGARLEEPGSEEQDKEFKAEE